ncbi:lipopolysaccharide biosynthesis protein [Halomarina litorea]|uniref:lipopolysaccharide biosynthesis protein n=1 Tax=Halomarina litorea TaxID=2961595 RepID=UPI0020C46556|nr:lipopolysaccharide biosynthesis protein [Halomarina sp. BCD28]
MKGRLRKLKRLLSPNSDLASQTVVGGMWVAFTNGGGRVLHLTMLVVLARLLSPSEFGVFGIALLALSALQRFSQLGINDALVQLPDADVDDYLDTAFTLRFIRGVVIAAVAYLLAPHVASVFGEPRATALLRAVVFATLFQTLNNPGTIYFEKDLEFHKQFAFVISGTFTRVSVSIGYALFVEATVWALAVGFLAGNFVQMVASYLIHDYRPWPGFDVPKAREMVGYGKWILGSGVVAFLFREGDDALVGVLLGSGALGLYQLSYRLSNAPATEIAQSVSRVVMPAYSKLQEDIEAVREGFFRALRLSTLVSFPVGVGIIVVAPPFVATFLGDQWTEMIVPMQVLTGFGLLRSIRSPTSPLFKALGRPDYMTKIQAVRLAVLAVLIYPLTTAYDLTGTAAAVLVTGLVSAPLGAVLAARLVEDDVTSFAAILAYPALGSAVMGAAAWTVREGVAATGLGSLVTFVATVLTGVAVYAAVMLALERRFQFGLSELLAQVKGAAG